MDETLAKDLLALWQSELTAMAADRELRENWVAMVALWAGSAEAALRLLPKHSLDTAAGSAGAGQPAGATPADASSQPRLVEIERLNHRIAELERRLGQILPPAGGDERA